MEFMVDAMVRFAPGLSQDEVNILLAEHDGALGVHKGAGFLLAVWYLSGDPARDHWHRSHWHVPGEEHLKAILGTLPLVKAARMFAVKITPVTRHPHDPGGKT